MDNYFVNRKTIRLFSDEKVGDELVHSLLGIASHAPTTGNMQLYSVVATRDEEKKNLKSATIIQYTIKGRFMRR